MSKLSIINVASFDTNDIICISHPKALGSYINSIYEFDVTLKNNKTLNIKSKSGNEEDVKKLYKIFTVLHTEWKGVDEVIILNLDENEENSEKK